MKRQRLDTALVARQLAPSREQARRWIMAGQVRVAGERVDKPGTPIEADAAVEVEAQQRRFVSRGGWKLEGALEAFGVEVRDRIVLDVGASTGGFTDCVLQRGAAAVIAVDVGYGQLDWVLRGDARVTLLERTNARYLTKEDLPQRPNLAVLDVSFISLTLVLPAVAPLLEPSADLIAMVKPQFEVGRSQVGKGGVVRDPAVQDSAVERVRLCAEAMGLWVRGECDSPLRGPKGNREIFLWLVRPGAGER